MPAKGHRRGGGCRGGTARQPPGPVRCPAGHHRRRRRARLRRRRLRRARRRPQEPRRLAPPDRHRRCRPLRSEEHTSELQSLMRISYAVFCLKQKKKRQITKHINIRYKREITTAKETTQQR